MKLVKCICILRHGHRTPADPLANSPFNTKNYGALTKQGAEAAHSKGETIRKSKLQFMASLDMAQHLKIYSSAYDRTITSAYQFTLGVMGLPFDPNTDVKKHIAFLYTYGYRKESLKSQLLFKGYSYTFIPKLEKHSKALMGASVVETKLKDIDVIRTDLEYHGYLCPDVVDLFKMHDHIKCIMEMGYELNPKTKNIFNYLDKRIQLIYLIDYRYIDPTIRKFTNHFIIKEIISNLSDTKQKLFVYGSHDGHMIALLIAMGYMPKVSPEYADTISIELYDDNGKLLINVAYNNESITSCINSGKGLMEMEQFISTLQKETFSSTDEYFSLSE
jgi:hypothetical protein